MQTRTHATWSVLIWLLPLLLIASCAARDMGGATASSPGYYDEADYGGEAYGSDGYDYDFEDDSVEGEILSPEGANLSSRARSSHGGLINTRGEFARDKLEEPPSPDPEPKPGDPADGSEIDVEAPEQPRDAAKQAAKKRQVIYTATMQVSVYDVDDAVAQAEALPERFGGWLHTRVDNQIVLRIPAEHLEQAMAVIAELGIVDYRLLEALDVTAQYTDLESRIRVLVEMQQQLQRLLEQAKNVEQALEIRKALDQVTMELELARARMRELAKSIAFSTLIVRFVARGPAHDIPSSNDPFPWVIELGVETTEYR